MAARLLSEILMSFMIGLSGVILVCLMRTIHLLITDRKNRLARKWLGRTLVMFLVSFAAYVIVGMFQGR